MGDVLLRVEENVLPNLAKAIMEKTGKSDPLTLPQFQEEIESIISSKDCKLQEKTVTKNGIYEPDEGYYGVGKMIINVPTLSSSDDNKYTTIFTENLGMVTNGKVLNAYDESITITPNILSFTEDSLNIEIQE